MRTAWLLVATLVGCGSAEGEATAPANPSESGPLVLELFTSQGCSSCPAADRVLAGLAKDPSLAPLAFHVDYWDDLGWADPFASPAWTERQQAYATTLRDRGVYTPQLVVGGGAGMVGSNVAEIQHAIARAPRPALLTASATWHRDHLEVSATAPAGAEVMVAVWQDGVSTEVTRGENEGKTLTGDRVVRTLVRVAAPGQHGSMSIPLDGSWRAGGAVAFAQGSDRRISASRLLAR